MGTHTLSYRAEIDGLRAIAVVSVIIYHAQFSLFGANWLAGGYLGVDIFFVISGYLITRIILSELQSSARFDFKHFYERRARRILPMLFVVICASFPFAWIKMLPSAMIEYAQSLLASIFFGSNFFFYVNTTEYGANSALLKPFLHTWSLGVEEQFYLVFPVIALLGYRYVRPYFLPILVVLSLVSLIASQLLAMRNSELNFYMPFTRFWELAVGSVLAYHELNRRPMKRAMAKQVLPILGLCLLIASIAIFDKDTPHPSLMTLMPIIGVALIMQFASSQDIVGKILGSKPFVWVGLISYSAYLWHFPIFAFARMDAYVDNYDKLSWIGLTVVLSVLSYFLVERPFRNKNVIGLRALLLSLLTGFVVITAASVTIITQGGFKGRIPSVVGFENFEADNRELMITSLRPWKIRDEEAPLFKDAKIKLLLIGNSHANDMYNALTQNDLAGRDIDVLLSDLPQLRCANEDIDDYAPVREAFYAGRNYQDATTIVVSTKYFRSSCETKKENQTASRDIDGLPYLIQRAQSDGKTVIVFGNTAEFGQIGDLWVADHVYGMLKNLQGIAFAFDQIKAEADYLLYTNLTDAILKNAEIEEIAAEFGVTYIDKVPLICDLDGQSCSAFTDDGFKTSYDYGHWTLEGAKYFGEKLIATGFLDQLR